MFVKRFCEPICRHNTLPDAKLQNTLNNEDDSISQFCPSAFKGSAGVDCCAANVCNGIDSICQALKCVLKSVKSTMPVRRANVYDVRRK